MTFHGNILGIVPGMQSLAVLGRATKMVPKDSLKVNRKKQTKNMIGGFTDIMVGTTMIGPTANIIAAVP